MYIVLCIMQKRSVFYKGEVQWDNLDAQTYYLTLIWRLGIHTKSG